MKIVLLIFIALADLFALFTLGYVGREFLTEMRQRKSEKSETKKTRETPSVPKIVERVEEETADLLLSDSDAAAMIREEAGGRKGRREFVNLGDIDRLFRPNDVVTLDELKNRKLVSREARRLKILAGGSLSKPLVVKAESFSLRAAKMIQLTGGTVILLK